jgi:hypothetical protein
MPSVRSADTVNLTEIEKADDDATDSVANEYAQGDLQGAYDEAVNDLDKADKTSSDRTESSALDDAVNRSS